MSVWILSFLLAVASADSRKLGSCNEFLQKTFSPLHAGEAFSLLPSGKLETNNKSKKFRLVATPEDSTTAFALKEGGLFGFILGGTPIANVQFTKDENGRVTRVEFTEIPKSDQPREGMTQFVSSFEYNQDGICVPVSAVNTRLYKTGRTTLTLFDLSYCADILQVSRNESNYSTNVQGVFSTRPFNLSGVQRALAVLEKYGLDGRNLIDQWKGALDVYYHGAAKDKKQNGDRIEGLKDQIAGTFSRYSRDCERFAPDEYIRKSISKLPPETVKAGSAR